LSLQTVAQGSKPDLLLYTLNVQVQFIHSSSLDWKMYAMRELPKCLEGYTNIMNYQWQ